MTKGFMGKILWVNLSDGTFKDEDLPEEIYRQYYGGYGLATKLIYERMKPKVDALGSESIFGFFPGLLCGTLAPLTGRYMVAGKSPLTGTWGDSNSGGFFGPEIKKCGYDGILIKGMAKAPKYIAIIDGKKEILDAADIWGLDAVETENKLMKKHGNVRVACIGQSGTKLSLISGIVNDKGRIAGRSGLGAVMGSKKLKALVLKGNIKIEVVDNDALVKITKEYNEGIQAAKVGSTFLWKSLGTPWMNDVVAKTGDAPIKNWSGTSAQDFPAERLDKITGAQIIKYKQKSYGCFACPVQCGAIMKIPDLKIEETHRPEYETCAAFGHLLLNDDLMSLFLINDLCNRGGIDTISTGSTVAFAIECYENGVISKKETGGLELKWGNSSAIVELVKKVINREGFGNLLADGSKRAAEKIGKGSEKYAMHSMGEDLPMHSPKYYKSIGMTYAFDPTPGKHTTGTLDMMAGGPMIKPSGLFEGFELPKKFKRAGDDRLEGFKLSSALWQSTSSLGLCQFAYFFQKYPLAELMKAVTGWDVTMDDVLKVGMRIQTLRQAFTLREGVKIINNKMPERTVDMDYLADYKGYCEKMGWNPENSYPLKETLSNLNLDFAIKDFY